MKPNHVAVAAVAVVLLALTIPSVSGAAAVDLGTASDFAVLAGAAITNSGTTTIVGDVGSDSQTGFDTVILTGTNHGSSEVTDGALADLQTAYNDARDRPDATPVGALDGLTLSPGVYTDDGNPDSMALAGTLTLDAGGDPDAVFIFQSGSTLLLSANSDVVLVDGAQACNVFWQVTSSATLETGSHLEGTIMALASITLGTGATINGAALAITGSVSMLGNTITLDPCDVPTTTSSSPSQTTTSSPSQTTTSSPSQTTTSSPSQTTTSSRTQTTTQSPTQSETPSPTFSETQSSSPPPTQSETQTTPPTTSSTQEPTTEIPVFPSTTVAVMASAAALGGAFLMMRRRL